MKHSYFSKEAAEALIGTRIRSLVEFRGVRAATTGKVIRANKTGHGIYTVGVEWDLPYRHKPPVDRFSRDEYYTHLEEVLP